MNVGTGIRRLDELLGGGIPPGRIALVYGPPFVGKETLAKRFFLEGLRNGEPSVMVVTQESATDLRDDFLANEPAYKEADAAGLARFVDTYSRSIGIEDATPGIEYVDSLMDLNALSLAVRNVERVIVPEHGAYRLIVDSASTLAAYTNAQTTFRFLQVLVGKAKRAGATTMFLLDEGMHQEADVQMFKHLADGAIELKAEGEKFMLRASGLGTGQNRGWIEYRFTDTELEITGSFAAGRIR